VNEHTIKVACQTCHIPEYAKVNATKMYWDWSTASDLKEGNPYHKYDSMGNKSYTSIKGDFVWKKNVKPDYLFFNGTADHHLITDIIDTVPVQINRLFGSYNDRKSKIWPVKIHKGKQPYDTQQKRLLQAKLWDAESGKGALWVDYDWESSLKAGMEYIDLPYSGQYDFVETDMYLPLNHMVSPATKSVSCQECHTRDEGRLAGLGGFYMPGRDRNNLLDTLGWFLVIASLGGILVHGGIRVVVAKKQNA
ncbi:MAG: cytochrome C, partial [Salinivirgaceae bacterium]